MAKIITFFNHKGGVGKTTLVHNLGFAIADAKKDVKILLIDADPQMNLTASMYGLSNSMEYSTDEDSNWNDYRSKYISLLESLNIDLKSVNTSKAIFTSKHNDRIDLLSGDISLSELEADLYGIIKNDNQFTRGIPHKFEQSIRKYGNYDYILIDTAPAAGSIINAILMMSSDYFIAPVAPSFFSLQAIDNLSAIFKSWIESLSKFETVQGFQGLSMKVKFLGLVVQLAKRYKGGGKNYTTQSEDWVKDVNNSVNRFQQFALGRGKSISETEFKDLFINSDPFIIEKCCDFTPQLRSIAEKEGIPVIYLTQEICRKHNKQVDITKENGQYRMSLDSIKESYAKIANGILRLK